MNQLANKKLTGFRSLFFREKYRFDQGNAFLVFVNFAMLVTTLVRQANGRADTVYWYVLAGLAGTWLLGYFLDKVVRVQDAQEKVALKRSPIWKENFNHHDKLHKKITDAHDKIDNIEKILIEIKNDLN